MSLNPRKGKIMKARHALALIDAEIILLKQDQINQERELHMSNKTVTEWASAAQLRYIDSLNARLGFKPLDNYDISASDASHLIDNLKSQLKATEVPPKPASWGGDVRHTCSNTLASAEQPPMPKTRLEVPMDWLRGLKDSLLQRKVMPTLGEINRILREAEARGYTYASDQEMKEENN